MIAHRRLVLLVLGTVLAGCGGDSLTLPSEGEPANIRVVDGDEQNGRVGTMLFDPIVVEVTDTRGRPVPGASVEFVFDDGAGSANPETATTNGAGHASSTVTLGTRTGPVTGRVRVPVPEGTVPVEAQFTAIALSADAHGIAPFEGMDQSAPVGSQLPGPLVVRVTDGFGNPISGVTIGWTAQGGGSVSEVTTQTDASGLTSVTRTLGPAAGQQTTTAAAENLVGSPVTFTHTATAGSASRVIKVSGDGQSARAGTELDQPLVVQLLDAQDNPIPNRAVSWVVGNGGGSASEETSTTDAEGRASTRWTLGPNPGSNTLNAVVSGLPVVTFSATGTQASSTTRITSDDPDPSSPGEQVRVSFSVTAGGGTPTGTVTVTASGGSETCSGSVADGFCNITLTAEGNRELTASYSGDSRFGGSSDTEPHRVANSAPTAAFDPPSCIPATPCQFTDQSTDPDGTVMSWSWSFGDGGSSGERNPQHTYGAAGTYDVTLRVHDEDGATDEVTHQVTVNTPPTAGDDSYQAQLGVSTPFGFEQRLLLNDSDPEGQILSAEFILNSLSGPGTIDRFEDNGTFDFTPTAEAVSGSVVTFRYRVRDILGALSNEATVTITVQ